MPRKKRVRQQVPDKTQNSLPVCWLKALYHFHVFHYRMPQTAAIAAITPFVPSPLTIKMAMIASLMQTGRHQEAEQLVSHLPKIKVLISPPSSAISFKAFLRYRSVPAIESSEEMDDTGSIYPSRPHTREYAIFSDTLKIFVGLPNNDLESIAKHALQNIRYIGCKDSFVWCDDVTIITKDEIDREPLVGEIIKEKQGIVALLADFSANANIQKIENVIPGSRSEEDYELKRFILPGRILTKARSRVFIRDLVQ